MKRSSRILVDIPHQIGEPHPGRCHNQLGIVDNDQIMITGHCPQDGSGSTPSGHPIPAPCAWQIDAAKRAASGLDRLGRQVHAERSEGRGVGDLPTGSNQSSNLALPNPGVLRVVHDSDDESHRMGRDRRS